MISKFKEELETKGNLYIKIKVRVNTSKFELVDIMSDDTLKINLAAAPEKNKANKELINYLAKIFSVNKKNIVIISGNKERVKLIRLSRIVS